MLSVRFDWRMRRLQVALALACLAVLWPAASVHASQDIPVASVTTYTLVPEARKVTVRADLTIGNEIPNFSLNFYELYVEGEARNLKAKSSSGTVRVSLGGSLLGFRLVRLTFPRITQGQTRKVTLTYDMAGGKPRSATLVRAGPAYALFCAAPYGDVQRSTLRIVVPAAFQVDTLGTTVPVERSTKDGALILTISKRVADYVACVEAIDESALTHDLVTTTDGHTVDVEGWPDDPTWAAEASKRVESGLPILERLIGLPFPKLDRVVVREVVSETLAGYAGLYDPETGIARVTEDTAQPHLVLHELSHIWFNAALLDARWFDEGYAEYFGRKVAAKSGVKKISSCGPPGKYPGSEAPDLDQWAFLSSTNATEAEYERVKWQYDAACWIVTQLAKAVGDDRMRDVIVALANDEIAYRGGGLGGGPSEQLVGKADWRQWLDLAEERAILPAHAKLDLAALLADYGISDPRGNTRRVELRDRYHELADVIGWGMPMAVRGPLATWNWDQADSALAIASQIQDERGTIAALVPELGAANAPLRMRFETALGLADLQAVRDYATLEEHAARTIIDVGPAVAVQRTPLEQLGLLGADPQGQVAAARTALLTGDAAEADRLAAEVNAELQGAETAGIIRGVAGTAGSATLVGLVVFAVLRRRPNAPASVPAGGPATAVGSTAARRLTPPSEIASRQEAASLPNSSLSNGPPAPRSEAPRPRDPFAPRPCWNCGVLNAPLAQVCPSCGSVLARRR